MTTSVQSKQLAETLSGDLNTFHPPEGSDFHCPEPRMDELIRSDSLPPLSPTTTVQVESPPSPLSPQTPLPTPAVPSFVSPISSYQTDASTSSPCFVKAVDSTQQRISAISVFQDDCPQVIVESPSLNISQAAVDAGRASLDAWQDESTRRDPEYNDDNDDGQSIASSGIAASITAFSHPQRESVQSISPTPRPTPPASIRNSLVATPRASLLGSMSRMSAAEISMLHGNSSISSNTSHVDTIRRSLQNTWRSSTADFPAPGSAQSTIRDAPMSRLALAAAGTAAGGVGSNGHYRPHMPVFTMADDMDDIVVDAPAPTASFSSSTVNTVVLADEYNPPKAKTTAATVAPAAAVVPSPASIGRANQLTKQQQRKSVQQQQQQQQKSSLAAKASNGNSIPAATATATAVTSKPVAGSGKTATVVGTKGTTASYGTVRGGRRQRGSIPWLPDEAPAPSAKKTPAQLEKDRYLKSSKK
ncbi:hypothetical protein BX666DRAFT_1920267 [Dichotomocladium elegans]|nr:hypothetical protein BX666DRAFT_1920267 [Dichotomocladium elegans]